MEYMLACSTLFMANLRWVTFLNRVFQIQLTLAIMKSISILPLWSQLTFRHYKTITHQNWLKSNTKHVADLILPRLYQKLHADRHLVDLRHQSSWGSILRPGFSPNRKKNVIFFYVYNHTAWNWDINTRIWACDRYISTIIWHFARMTYTGP